MSRIDYVRGVKRESMIFFDKSKMVRKSRMSLSRATGQLLMKAYFSLILKYLILLGSMFPEICKFARFKKLKGKKQTQRLFAQINKIVFVRRESIVKSMRSKSTIFLRIPSPVFSVNCGLCITICIILVGSVHMQIIFRSKEFRTSGSTGLGSFATSHSGRPISNFSACLPSSFEVESLRWKKLILELLFK